MAVDAQCNLKNSVIRVRLTTHEKIALEKLSNQLFGRKNISKLMRKLGANATGLGADFMQGEREEFTLAVRHIAGIARNLNQLVRLAHMGKLNEDRLRQPLFLQLQTDVTRVEETLKIYINNVRNHGKVE